MTTTEIEQRNPAALQLIDQLGIKFSDPNELAMIVAGRLAQAQTPDELFEQGGSNGWENHKDEPYLVRRIFWLESAFEQGAGFYAVVEAAHAETGELAVLTTGSVGVIIQLARAEQMGWLDKPLTLTVNEKPTSSGYYPHRLKLA